MCVLYCSYFEWDQGCLSTGLWEQDQKALLLKDEFRPAWIHMLAEACLQGWEGYF